MREILFRAKRTLNGEWVEGDLMHEAFDGTSQTIEVGIRSKLKGHYCYPVEVIPETIEQFTGLIDSEGNKIFSGAEWQDKRMYSKEECYRILHNLMTDIKLMGLKINDDIDLLKWFNQQQL